MPSSKFISNLNTPETCSVSTVQDYGRYYFFINCTCHRVVLVCNQTRPPNIKLDINIYDSKLFSGLGFWFYLSQNDDNITVASKLLTFARARTSAQSQRTGKRHTHGGDCFCSRDHVSQTLVHDVGLQIGQHGADTVNGTVHQTEHQPQLYRRHRTGRKQSAMGWDWHSSKRQTLPCLLHWWRMFTHKRAH